MNQEDNLFSLPLFAPDHRLDLSRIDPHQVARDPTDQTWPRPPAGYTTRPGDGPGTAGPGDPIGVAGPAGPNGMAGPVGSIGMAGPVGPIGTTRPTELVGTTEAGVAGQTGVAGQVGVAGPCSSAEVAGQAEGAGSRGPAGVAGQTGSVGPCGPSGPLVLDDPAGPLTRDDPSGPPPPEPTAPPPSVPAWGRLAGELSSGAEGTQAPFGWAGGDSLDWAAVAQMRQAASTRLSKRIGSERPTPEEQRRLGRAVIADLLEERAGDCLARGLNPWNPAYQARMGQAVFDTLFRLGRLQPLVDDESIENIIIDGADNVWIESSDGGLAKGPPVADSDQELIDFLSFIAARSEANERSFSPAEPRLHLRLDSGARLAAAAWVTPRPAVVIRRHRLQEVTLTDLVERQTMSRQTADFLQAAVQRRASIVVSGAQGAGKTTLMRALTAVIPPDEIIGTFETEYELGLHLMPERHRVVYAWEARPGSGESDATGHRAGEFLLDDALYDSFRFNLSRQIVGEVRGHEILAMLKAMQSGSGSLSTTHASSAEAAIRKLITCAMEAGGHVTAPYATRAIAEAIDFVVHMEMATDHFPGGRTRRHRWVGEILAVQPSDSARGYSTTRLFSTDPGERLARLDVLPGEYIDVLDPTIELRNQPWP